MLYVLLIYPLSYSGFSFVELESYEQLTCQSVNNVAKHSLKNQIILLVGWPLKCCSEYSVAFYYVECHNLPFGNCVIEYM